MNYEKKKVKEKLSADLYINSSIMNYNNYASVCIVYKTENDIY